MNLLAPAAPTLIPVTHANIEAEQALLGAILINNDALLQVPCFFRQDHFFEAVHQRIYSALAEFYRDGKQANPITLKNRFDADETLSTIGGAAYLMRLATGLGGVVSVPDYCEMIHDLWMRRQLTERCMATLAALASDFEKPATQVAAEMITGADEILTDGVQHQVQTDFDVDEEILRDLNSERKPNLTGIPKLDEAMDGGLFPEMLYGFAARKKVGKTALAATLSVNLAQQGVKHVFICAEMSPKQTRQRMLARLTDSYSSAFRSGYGKSMAFQTKIAHLMTQSSRCILFEKKPGITFQELQQIIPVYAVRHKVSGFILDYWQLVGGKPGRSSTAEHLDEVANWLAHACRRYGIWGIVMAQINQEGNTRGSEGLRLAVNQLYEIHREDLTKPQTWLEMLETRDTAWANVGDSLMPGLMMREKGPYFEQA